jgi:hypothetical protein
MSARSKGCARTMHEPDTIVSVVGWRARHDGPAGTGLEGFVGVVGVTGVVGLAEELRQH